ncbi:P-loop containing nucleoside triphosphate hydrolase protein [Syncephalastrum racemosum]|uniref:P-loop containing nucleoside triphosphate hydrolase protein n=1 Tax=Syncephalastrum racemosum TaxID=13706 RepID=A0A1X2H1B3_SYNRA|nr:P-loop containing nucleoside triphosphate hydrolase protein [Syncephalastrum racemosum]
MNLDPAAGGEGNTVDYYASQISLRTSGYVARDLSLLCRRALLHALRDNPDDMVDRIARLHIDQAEPMETDAPTSSSLVQWKNFSYALAHFRPSQQVQIESTLPKRSWEELGGYHKIKDRIRKATLLPLSQPTLFSRLGIKPPSGVLLYGPSGCGKTALVQALASESMMNVMSINGPEIFSKYLGETELKIRRLFANAKRIAPCILFIDEFDAIGSKRGWSHGESSGGVNERVMSTLLNEMDGVEGRQGVIVIGCTSCPDQIDDAILRPGRMDQVLYVGLPDLEDRKEIIQAIMLRMTVEASLDVDTLARQTEFCTGADIDQIFRAAGTVALREDIEADSIKNAHIQAVLADIAERARQRVIEEDSLLVYEQFQNAHASK